MSKERGEKLIKCPIKFRAVKLDHLSRPSWLMLILPFWEHAQSLCFLLHPFLPLRWFLETGKCNLWVAVASGVSCNPQVHREELCISLGPSGCPVHSLSGMAGCLCSLQQAALEKLLSLHLGCMTWKQPAALPRTQPLPISPHQENLKSPP